MRMAWSPDGNRLVSASFVDGERLWDVVTGKILETFLRANNPNAGGLSVAWSPYGGRLAYVGSVTDSAVARTQTLVGSAIQIVVPSPSLDELQTITKRCTGQPELQQRLISRADTAHLPDFISEVKKLPKEQMPPACAADLIAVANALQQKR